jgi:uncharacterized protein with FMN-binding domain
LRNSHGDHAPGRELIVRRITLFLISTVAALVLLFGYRTSRGPGAPAGVDVAGPGVGIVPNTAASAAAPGSAAGSGTTASGQAVTVNGTVARTRWGPVQVQVTIQSGRITNVTALQYPTGNGRDREINTYALPQLHDQVISAQSANIDGVSGATVTSDGYTQSLQAALDTVHFR